MGWREWLSLAAALLSLGIRAETLDASLGEQIVMIPKGSGLFSTQLQTTLYKPPGAGPFPLVVINHGKAPGNPHFQPRARYPYVARELLSRGFVVVIPMRAGFAGSGGGMVAEGCNSEAYGQDQADDVIAALDWLTKQAYVDARHIVVMGQSTGGLTTMAFATHAYPGVLGVVNFTGGVRQTNCPGWESRLARTFQAYGAAAKYPSLWFYGDNDSYWQPWLFHKMHEGYVAAGGQARLIAYGHYGSDSHAMFGSRDSTPIWLPPVEAFFVGLGLDISKKYSLPAPKPANPVPPKSGFAAVEDVAAVPGLSDKGKEAYQKYLTQPQPKAFAIGAHGGYGWQSGDDLAVDKALAACGKHSETCRLYAVDDDVVWSAAP